MLTYVKQPRGAFLELCPAKTVCAVLFRHYGKLFSWIVHRINALLRTDRRRPVLVFLNAFFFIKYDTNPRYQDPCLLIHPLSETSVQKENEALEP